MIQIEFPFACDRFKLKEFLTKWLVFENEEERLREEKRLLKNDFMDDMPMRAVLTAVKVVRSRAKLALHAKEPFSYAYQTVLERAVEDHILSESIEELVSNTLLEAQGEAIRLSTGDVA